jgi:hypothetical protein
LFKFYYFTFTQNALTMTQLPRSKHTLPLLLLLSFCAFAKAQTATTKISQDPEIETLISLKAEMSLKGNLDDRYKIQIYSGNQSSANGELKKFLNKVGTWRGNITYETPNYKVWIGNFRNLLEADRALIKVKMEFPSAFIFKPER